MNIIQSTILGLVQGLTEFIPISSSGHLVIIEKVLGFKDLGLVFDAFLHLGTLLAVLIYFRKDFISFFRETNKNKNLIKQIFITILPAGIAGLFLEDIISSFFRDTLWVSAFMILVGIIFLLAEKYNKIKITKKEMKEMDWKDSLFIGIAQIFALFPGISRSGITIAAGMFRSLKRVQATRFSFLMSAVIILAASSKSAVNLFIETNSLNEILIITWGGFVAFVSGYFSIKFLMKFLAKHKLHVFSIYLFIIGFILFILSWN